MNQKVILCYGDSNTWGYIPTTDYTLPCSRYDRHTRWTGILQEKLGQTYYVIEEGLNSRTTNIDYPVPPERNGKTYLPPCLYSHSPIDIVILALGGNDSKSYFNRSGADIANGLIDLIDTIQQSPYGSNPSTPPKIILLSCIQPLPFVEDTKDENQVPFLLGCVDKIKSFNQMLPKIASDKGCHMIDINKIAAASAIDGAHLDPASHYAIAELLAEYISKKNSTVHLT